MRDNPRVAVFMSCYNHEKYVGMAVDSVLQQTHSNLEFFIVNDGSTDNSGRILESYKDDRIHYFDFKKNTRFVGASNFLMKIMRDQDCDYIACIASDDMWEKDKLERQISYLRRHPEYKACFTWDRLIYSEDWEGNKYSGDYSHKKNQSRYDWLCDLFWNGNCLNACSMLMEKDVFYEIGGMNENFYIFGDYRAWMLLVRKYPMYLMEEELTVYRRHKTNISNQNLEYAVRYYNELYTIYRELLLSMEKNTFRRTFYPKLIYSNCNTEEELLAEKFIMLLPYSDLSFYAQTAMDIYYNNSENEAFISTLEERYYFDSVDFITLTGNAGMLYTVNNMTKQDTVPRSGNKVRFCSPGMILLEAIDRKKVNESTLSDYRYTTLMDLYEQTSGYEDGERQFQQVRQWIDQVRDRRMPQKGKRILFIIAEDSFIEPAYIIEELGLDGENSLAAAVVHKKEYCFTEYQAQADVLQLPEEMRRVDLYHAEEHCLRFADEVGERPDVIYYVDCLGEEYECADMLCGYSLDIQYHCILSAERYEELLRQNAAALGIMGEIHVINQ